MEFDLENPLPSYSITALFLHESDHMPTLNSSNADLHSSNDIRRQTISLISHFSLNFHYPFLSYLATNYLHRFLSSHSIPKGKPWILRLVAVSCISLALKMRKTEHPLSDIQKNGGLMFDVQTVERMELLILGALKWRMRSITPFSFVNFFIVMFKFKDSSLHHHHQVLKERATEIIFKAQIESKLLEHKPSIIAASALVFASHELYPLQFPNFKKAISSCSYVDEDDFSKCYCSIQEIVMDGYESVLDTLSSCTTPINVLDLNYSSSSSSSSSEKEKENGEEDEEERGLKRRKISSCKNPNQLSQCKDQRILERETEV